MATMRLEEKMTAKNEKSVGAYIRALATSGQDVSTASLDGLMPKAGKDAAARRTLIRSLLPEVLAVSCEWQGKGFSLQDLIERGNRTLCAVLPGLCRSLCATGAGSAALRFCVRSILEESFARRSA